MSQNPETGKLRVEEFARQIQGQMIPLNNSFSYFFTALALSEEDIKEYLEDPVGALPPAVAAILPPISVLLVPYLEKPANGAAAESANGICVSFERPEDKSPVLSARLPDAQDSPVFAFAVKDQDVADYHYRFYRRIAEIVAERCGDDVLEQFYRILRDELGGGVHGEVDEESWQLKQALLRRQRRVGRHTKGFARYALQAFLDTMTLYLHGICCDIDVETGPRQIASKHLRRRLVLLQSLYPPPDGYAVFPEDMNHLEEASARGQ